MTVIELINQLQDMPHNAQVLIEEACDHGGYNPPNPQMEWNDFAENYVVVL